MKKHNEGFTLVELLVAIVAGSIVTAATATILLLGLRMNAHSNEITTVQNQVRITLSVLADMVKKSDIDTEKTADNKVFEKSADPNNPSLLFSCTDGKVTIGGTNVVLLEGIEESSEVKISADNKTITIKLVMDEKEYSSTILLRTGQTITIP